MGLEDTLEETPILESQLEKRQNKFPSLGEIISFDFGLGSVPYSAFRAIYPYFPIPLTPIHFIKKLLHESLHLLGDSITGVETQIIKFADNFYSIYSRTLEHFWPDKFQSSPSLFAETGFYTSIPDPEIQRTVSQQVVMESLPYLLMPLIGSIIIEYGNSIKNKELRAFVKGVGVSIALDPVFNNLLNSDYLSSDLYKLAENCLSSFGLNGHLSQGEFYAVGIGLGFGLFFLSRFAAKKLGEGISVLHNRYISSRNNVDYTPS
jgi:hypothetical protein